MNIEDLILQGVLEPAGVDSNTGEILYNFTSKLKDFSPTLHREINNMFSSHIMTLWELKMVDMDITAENPNVKLTKNAFNPKLISKLNDDVAHTLREIKRNLVR